MDSTNITQEIGENDDDPILGVLEMLNFSAVRRPPSEHVGPSGNSTRNREVVNSESGQEEAILEESHHDLVIQNIMLSSELLLCRERNLKLDQTVDTMAKEINFLKKKAKLRKKQLQEVTFLSTDLQKEFEVLMKGLLVCMKEAVKPGEATKVYEFLNLFEVLCNKIPVTLQQSDPNWNDVKNIFHRLKSYFANSSTPVVSNNPRLVSTGMVNGERTEDNDKDLQKSSSFGNADGAEDDDIRILEEFIAAASNIYRPSQTAAVEPFYNKLPSKESNPTKNSGLIEPPSSQPHKGPTL